MSARSSTASGVPSNSPTALLPHQDRSLWSEWGGEGRGRGWDRIAEGEGEGEARGWDRIAEGRVQMVEKCELACTRAHHTYIPLGPG